MISIVGAGPVGNYLAYLLAKEGKEVSVFEEHKKIGEPVQCTGITTEDLRKVIKVDESFVVNRLSKVKVFSKNEKVEIKLNEIVLDRCKLDSYWGKKAEKEGTNFYLGYRFLDYKRKLKFQVGRKIKEFETDILVGADGPFSRVYNLLNIKKREYFNGMQVTLKLENEGDSFETYFGDVCPGFFAWVVPENKKRIRIGLAMRSSPRGYFNKFLAFRVGKDYEKKIESRQHGLIPYYSKVNVQKENVFLVGDAANHVKATTGGGLVPGFKAASCLAEAMINNKEYNKCLRKLNFELWLSLRIRKALEDFSDSDYDNILNLMKNEKVKELLYEYSRDEPFSLIWRLLIKEPRFLKYFGKVV